MLEAKRALDINKVRDRQRRQPGKNTELLALEVEDDIVAAGRDGEVGPRPGAGEVERPDERPRAWCGAVVFDAQVLRRKLEVGRVDAKQADVVGLRLERAVDLATNVFDIQITEVQALDAKAVEAGRLLCEGLVGVDRDIGITGEGADIAAADREAARALHDARRPAAGFERVAKIGLLESDAAAEVQEARDRQRRLLGVHTKAAAAGEVDDHIAVEADRQATVAKRGDEVDRRALRRRAAVHLEAQAFGLEDEIVCVDAVQPGAVHARLQRRERLPAGFGEQQAEGRVLDAKAVEARGLLVKGLGGIDAAFGITDKDVDLAAGDRQHRRDVRRHRGADRRAQLDRRRGRVFFEADATREVSKVRHLQRDLGLGADELAGTAVDIKSDAFARADGHLEILRREVDDPVDRARGLVHLQLHIFDRRQVEVRQADELEGRRRRLHRCPLARRRGLRGEHREAEVDVVQAQADFVGGAAVDTCKYIDVRRADGEHIHRHHFSRRHTHRRQRHRRGAFFDRKTAADLEEAKGIDRDRALRAQHRALGAVDIECDLVCGQRPAGDDQIGGTRREVEHRLRRQAGAIDLHQQIVGGQGQAFGQADDFDRAGRGLQRRPLARRGDTDAGFFSHQRDAKFDAGELQAKLIRRAAINTGKRRHAAGADRQQVGADRLGRRDFSAVGIEHRRGDHILAAFFDRKPAVDVEEAKQVEREVATRLECCAVAARHVEQERIAGAGADFKFGCAGGKVDHLVAGLGGLVDGHTQGVAGQREAFDADKSQAARAGLDSSPLAGGVDLGRHQGDGKFGVGQFQADLIGAAAVDPDKSLNATAAHREQVGVDRACIGQRDDLARLLESEVAFEHQEAEDIELDMARCADQVTQRAIAIERDAVGRPGDHGQRLGQVIDDEVGCARQPDDAFVDLDTQVGGAGLKTFDADKLDARRVGLDGAEFARRCDAGFAHHCDRKVNIRQLQAQVVGRRTAAVDAGKSVDIRAADGQQVDGQVAVVAEFDRGVALFDGKAAAQAEEAKRIERQVAGGAQQLAVAAGHIQG